MRMSNYTPGFVESYDPAKHQARVSWPGMTGVQPFPKAELLLPIGCAASSSDFYIQPGDRVWLDFVNGDPRFPIIQGYRAPETDNAVDVRRLVHLGIELEALDGDVVIKASGNVVIQATKLIVEADIESTGTVKNNSKNIGSTHGHIGVQTGGGTSGPPA